MGSARYVYILRAFIYGSALRQAARIDICKFPGSPGAEIMVERPSVYISLGGLLCDLLGAENASPQF